MSLSTQTALPNPATTGGGGTPRAGNTVNFTAYDAVGAPISPSAGQPLVVNIYGAGSTFSTGPAPTGSGTQPITVLVQSGNSFTYDYDGGYLPGPVTIQAYIAAGSTNVCSNSGSYAIGATTVPLAVAPTQPATADANLPATCSSGAPGTCAGTVVDTTGIRLRTAVGYAQGSSSNGTPAPPVSHGDSVYRDFTVDTGSLGVALPASELGPNAIGPAGPSYKYYDSSGFEYVGYLYLTPLTLTTDSGSDVVTTLPVRVLAVYSSGCYPGSSCTVPPDPSAFHYLGIGFDRNDPSPSSPFASPTDNALLQLADVPGGTPAAGYILSGTGVQVGMSPSQTAGFATVPLTASGVVPGDWLTAPGFASVTHPGDTPQWEPATVLVDTGITEMFIDAASGLFHELDPTDSVGVITGTSTTSPPLDYDFLVGTGRQPTPIGMNPLLGQPAAPDHPAHGVREHRPSRAVPTGRPLRRPGRSDRVPARPTAAALSDAPR